VTERQHASISHRVTGLIDWIASKNSRMNWRAGQRWPSEGGLGPRGAWITAKAAGPEKSFGCCANTYEGRTTLQVNFLWKVYA